MVQVLICIYIVCYFPNMEADRDESFIEAVSRNQFSGQMVIVLTFCVLLIIYDRYIYKCKTAKSSHEDTEIVPVNKLPRHTLNFTRIQKLYLQWIMIFVMHASLFFYLPIQGNMKLHGTIYCDLRYITTSNYSCNDINRNPSLWWFYGLCCTYLFVSALQIRHGLPEDVTGYFMMHRYHWSGKFPF